MICGPLPGALPCGIHLLPSMMVVVCLSRRWGHWVHRGGSERVTVHVFV